MANEPTPTGAPWSVELLTSLFLANGVGALIFKRDGRLFSSAPCPEPTKPWHPAKPEGECLLFSAGSVLPYGHRRISVGGKMRLVHVVAYELAIGPVPPGLVLAHRCVDHEECASPGHVRPETRRVNGREGGLRVWPDEVLTLGPSEICPRCDTTATTTVQIDRAGRNHMWSLICPAHASLYVRQKRAGGERAWAGKWYRPMPATVQALVDEHLAARSAATG